MYVYRRHLRIIFVSSSYHLRIIFVSSSYHLRIIFVSSLYHLCIIFVSSSYHLRIIFVSSSYHLEVVLTARISTPIVLNVGKVFNPVLKLVFENYPFSCLSQLRSPHFAPIVLFNRKNPVGWPTWSTCAHSCMYIIQFSGIGTHLHWLAGM